MLPSLPSRSQLQWIITLALRLNINYCYNFCLFVVVDKEISSLFDGYIDDDNNKNGIIVIMIMPYHNHMMKSKDDYEII